MTDVGYLFVDVSHKSTTLFEWKCGIVMKQQLQSNNNNSNTDNNETEYAYAGSIDELKDYIGFVAIETEDDIKASDQKNYSEFYLDNKNSIQYFGSRTSEEKQIQILKKVYDNPQKYTNTNENCKNILLQWIEKRYQEKEKENTQETLPDIVAAPATGTPKQGGKLKRLFSKKK